MRDSMPCVFLNVYFLFLTFPKNKFLKKGCWSTLSSLRIDNRRKMTRLMLFRKRFFSMYLVPNMWAADVDWGRICSSSLCYRGSFPFAEANVNSKTLRTLFPPSLILLFHALTFLPAFGVSDAQEKEIKLRSEHITQLQTCHSRILRCHGVSQQASVPSHKKWPGFRGFLIGSSQITKSSSETLEYLLMDWRYLTFMASNCSSVNIFLFVINKIFSMSMNMYISPTLAFVRFCCLLM